MNDLPTPAPRGTGPWRLLVLDRDPVDPRWLFATISIPSDIRPAVTDEAGHYQQWEQVSDWVGRQFPGTASLAPVHDALAWTVTEGGPR